MNSLKQNVIVGSDNVSRKELSSENQHFGEPLQSTKTKTSLAHGKSESESKANTTPLKSTPVFDRKNLNLSIFGPVF